MFASGPPTLPSGPQANGAIGAPVPARPFENGTVPPGPMPVVRPPPPQSVPFPPMQLTGQAPWQGQPIPSSVMPPPMQFRPPPQSALSRPSPTNGNGSTTCLAPTSTTTANGWKAPYATDVNATPSPTSIYKLKITKSVFSSFTNCSAVLFLMEW